MKVFDNDEITQQRKKKLGEDTYKRCVTLNTLDGKAR